MSRRGAAARLPSSSLSSLSSSGRSGHSCEKPISRTHIIVGCRCDSLSSRASRSVLMQQRLR